jgi:hypothetical protein
MNPRTDIEKVGYGYSIVEQAIDLVTSSINTFMYNAGFFTENKLPRGILLLQGDADTQEVEQIEDYIVNIMSGTPASQWRVPIIPSGKPDGGGEGSGRKFEWVNLQRTNKEMEFQTWFDLQLSGLTAMFGSSLEDLGLHSSKSQSIIGTDNAPLIESSKSLVLGDVLAFLQGLFNRILEYKNPDYELEIVGYERDDPKLTMDIDKTEVETYKSVDEKRVENGLAPFNEKWSGVPLNAYVVQLMGQDQQGGGPFGGDMGEGGEEAGDAEGGAPEDEDGGSGWDDIDDRHSGDGAVKKSIVGQRDIIRITI